MDHPVDDLGFTCATYVYLCHRDGCAIGDVAVAAACRDLDQRGDVPALADRLRVAVRSHLSGEDADAVRGALSKVFGAGSVHRLGEGADQEARLGALRRVSFGDSRPWLAWIADRTAAGLVSRLVLVERFADSVTLLDSNPWDDVPEDRVFPVGEFLLRWELAGSQAVRVS